MWRSLEFQRGRYVLRSNGHSAVSFTKLVDSGASLDCVNPQSAAYSHPLFLSICEHPQTVLSSPPTLPARNPREPTATMAGRFVRASKYRELPRSTGNTSCCLPADTPG